MTVNYTTNLSLGQPVTGTESGTWGDDVNNAVTSYLDIAIAGGLSVTVTVADVTLTLTQGTSSATNIGSTTAQYAILNVSGAMTAARNLILPSSSRQYVINNACTGGFLLTVKGSATSGVTLVNGEKAHVFWNGSDYAKLSNTPGGAGTFSSITNTGLTSGRVVFSTTGGLETDSANLTFDGTNLTLLGGTANGVAYLNGSKVLTTGSALTFDGTNLLSGTGSGAALIRINGASSGAGGGSAIAFGGAGSYPLAIGYSSAVLGGAYDASMLLYAGGGSLVLGSAADIIFSNNGRTTEYMRVTSGGLVGIGTSSPSSKLAVNGGTSTSQIRWEVNSASFVNEVSTNAAASAYVYKQYDALYHVWKISSSTAMTLDSGGRLGVGVPTINSGFIAQFNGDIGLGSPTRNQTTTAKIGVRTSNDPADDSRSSVLFGTTAGAASSDSYIAFNTNQYGVSAGERVRIDPAGNVGIGTTTPSTYGKLGLSVSATASAVTKVIGFQNSAGVDAASLRIAGYNYVDGVQTAIDFIQNSASDFKSQIAFSNNAGAGLVERMRIDSSGNLLVGTTAQLAGIYRLVVNTTGSGSTAGALFVSNQSTVGNEPFSAWQTATTGDNVFCYFGTEASFTTRGSISYNRAGGLTVYNTTSDYRAKEIYGPVSDSGALIDSVPVYMGKMKGATQERPMFLAHETPAYAHTGKKDEVDENGKPIYQQMDASALIPVMWAEIQNLRKRLTALESKEIS